MLDDRPRNATVRSLTPCDLLLLDAGDFRRIVDDFPLAEAGFRAVAEGRREPSGE